MSKGKLDCSFSVLPVRPAKSPPTYSELQVLFFHTGFGTIVGYLSKFSDCWNIAFLICLIM